MQFTLTALLTGAGLVAFGDGLYLHAKAQLAQALLRCEGHVPGRCRSRK